MVCYHSINSGSNLKGAGIIRGPQARQIRQTITFPQTEISLVSKSLEILRFYISKNQEQFQQPENMLQKINQAIEIISTKTTAAATKGASNNNNNNNNICHKKEHLKELLNMFHL